MGKQYTEDNLQLALDAIANGIGKREAERQFGIPKSTLLDRLNGQQSRKEAFSGFQRLSPTQESLLTS